MKKYLIIDEYTCDHDVVEANSPSEAANIFSMDQLQGCLSPKLVQRPCGNQALASIGAETFMDEASAEGWGEGCKFEGQVPEHQLIVVVIELK